MKLKNKKTGEIVEIMIYKADKNGNRDVFSSVEGEDSLAELNEEWEDAPEEPKEYWCIDWTGGVNHITLLDDSTDKYEKAKKQIGNYFETEEEAKKAVEKLKAWKRLKSHDLFISKGNRTFVNTDDVFVVQNVQFRVDTYGEVEDDLDICFGGEDD